jgi:hypothetical protein
LNPRRTFQHVRDFQSRSLDRSDTSPEGAQRIELAAGRQVVEVEIGVLAGSDANTFPVELELDLDACRRADGVEPVSLLDCVPSFVERPCVVVDDAAPALRVTDRADMPVGTTDDADDPVLGDAPPPRRFQLAASLLLSDRPQQ